MLCNKTNILYNFLVDERNKTECIHHLKATIGKLHDEDFIALSRRVLDRKCVQNETRCVSERLLFLDVIGSTGDAKSQRLMVDHVLGADRPNETDVEQCLFHCIVLQKPLPVRITPIFRSSNVTQAAKCAYC
jgi:hypothetical protein